MCMVNQTEAFMGYVQQKRRMTTSSLLYADQAATSYPVLFPTSHTASFVNPSSAHQLGREAKAALNAARVKIAQSLGLTSGDPQLLEQQIVFTSGGTESNNLVIQQPIWKFIITIATEHHSVFFTTQYMQNHHSCEVVFLSVDGQGRVKDVSDIERLLITRLSTGMGLVSVAYVNNETGTIQDLASIGMVLQKVNRKRSNSEKVWLHSDAVQAPGHVMLSLAADGGLGMVDFLSLAAHKFHGPLGVGLLVCRTPGILQQPLFYGGDQQSGLRPGTEPVTAIVSMANALQDANQAVFL